MAANTQYDQTVSDIEATLGFVPGFMQGIPTESLVAEWPTMKKYVFGESEIPQKYRELTGLAVASNIKCPYCIHFHRGVAQLYGATDEELAELATLASVTSRWSAMLHAQEYDMDTFVEESQRIAAHVQGKGKTGVAAD
jgi:AhpD family alkylhydroperoxidase